MVAEKYVYTSRLIQTMWKLSCTVTETVYTSKIMKLIWNWQITSHFCQNELFPELSWHILQALHCTGWNNCSILKQTTTGMDVLFLITFFRLYPGLKMSFEHIVFRKNLFLSACLCWYSRLSLHEKDQKLKFAGTIVYGGLYLEFHFVISESLDYTQYAILHDAAGALQAHSGKGPGYSCVIGRGPKSFLLGHVTGLLYCLYVRLFLNSISNLSTFEAVYLAL